VCTERIIEGDTEDTFITDRVEMMIRESKKQPYYTRLEALAHIGSHFRHVDVFFISSHGGFP